MVLKVSHPEDGIFNRVISDASVAVRKTTLTISDVFETCSPVENEIMRVVPLSTTEITEIKRFEMEKNDLQGKTR